MATDVLAITSATPPETPCAHIGGRPPAREIKRDSPMIPLCPSSGQRFASDNRPQGICGYLTASGAIASWYLCASSHAEFDALCIKVGACAAQQTVEALAAFVALRAWRKHGLSRQSTIRPRSDSISGLTILSEVKTKG